MVVVPGDCDCYYGPHYDSLAYIQKILRCESCNYRVHFQRSDR